MPSIKFLDGSTKNFPDNVTGIEIAKSISPSLSKDAIAIVIDGIQKDLNFVIVYCTESGRSASIILANYESQLANYVIGS